jgi:hypothetical protein
MQAVRQLENKQAFAEAAATEAVRERDALTAQLSASQARRHRPCLLCC